MEHDRKNRIRTKFHFATDHQCIVTPGIIQDAMTSKGQDNITKEGISELLGAPDWQGVRLEEFVVRIANADFDKLGKKMRKTAHRIRVDLLSESSDAQTV